MADGQGLPEATRREQAARSSDPRTSVGPASVPVAQPSLNFLVHRAVPNREELALADDESIRIRAYQIWENEGRPAGRDIDHWRQACDELSPPARDDIAAAAPLTPKPADDAVAQQGGSSGSKPPVTPLPAKPASAANPTSAGTGRPAGASRP